LPPSPRSRTGAFSSAHARLRAVRSCARLRSYLAAQRQGRFPLTPRARARMPRSASTPPAHPRRPPEPPCDPPAIAGFTGGLDSRLFRVGGCFGGRRCRLSPAAPFGPGCGFHGPGGAASGRRRAARAARTPALLPQPRLPRAYLVRASSVPSSPATRMHTGSRSRRVLRTPYRNPEPARHAALRDDIQEHRVAGLADRGQPHPLGGPARIRTGTVTAATLAAAAGAESSAPARRVAGSLRTGCARRLFRIPSVAAAAAARRASATTPGAGAAAGTPGRGLCAWIYAPARRPAVLIGCRHAVPATRVPIAGSRCAEPCGAWQV